MPRPLNPTYGWNGDELDLDAYLERIGFSGEPAPTLETLRALQRGHVTSIPFENLEIMLGRTVPLELDALQDKLVRRRRGGYCYEHVKLFTAALERIGFGVTGLQGRVTIGAVDARPATHALARVTTADDDRVWLCDVGFGRGPLEPLEFPVNDGGEVEQDGWRFRFERRLERRVGDLGADLWALHQYGPQGWVERHRFTLDPKYTIDYVVGSHYVSTHPRSPFTMRPFVQRFAVDRHDVLDGVTYSMTGPDGTVHEQRAVDPADLPGLLSEVFGIRLEGADADAAAEGFARSPREAGPALV